MSIILLIYGLMLDSNNKKIYKLIERETNFQCKSSLFTPTLEGNIGGYYVIFKMEQGFLDLTEMNSKITIYHPNNLFPARLHWDRIDVYQAYAELGAKNAVIKKNRELIITIDHLPKTKTEILNMIHKSIILAKTIDIAK